MPKHVLVTTEHRGVFFGRMEKEGDYDRNARRIVLKGCRNVIYWSGSRGFLGLASHGPEKGSKVGSEAPSVELHSVTSVADATPEAAKAFKDWTN